MAALAFPLIASAASPGPVGPQDRVEGCAVAGASGPGGASRTYSPTAGGLETHGSVTVTVTQVANGITTTTRLLS